MRTYPKLISVTPMENYQLLLAYANKEKRLYDFRPNLDHPFFKALVSEELFKKVSAADGGLEWVTGQDFCPHTLYSDSKPVNQ